MESSRRTLIALAIPILALAALAAEKSHRVHSGERFVFPISGYDPRDLLSGNYLQFTVDYGAEHVCERSDRSTSDSTPASICLAPAREFSWQPFGAGEPRAGGSCRRWITGNCRYGRFQAGVEKFYVPQEKAQALEKRIRSKKAQVVVAIGDSGEASIVDLEIEGQSWKNAPDPGTGR